MERLGRGRFQGFLSMLSIVVYSALALPAFAEVADEHPEWFGMTSPPQGSVTLSTPGPATRFYLAPQEGQGWREVIRFLLSRGEVTLLVEDGGARDAVETWLYTEDLSQVAWIELGPLAKFFAGEWGPLPLTLDDGLGLVDPRYYQARPWDDAAGSRVGEAVGAPVFRPPLFLTRSHVQGDGQGRCLISWKIYSINAELNEAEIDHALAEYLGCTQIGVIEPFSSDGAGSLEHLVRIAGPGHILLSSYSGATQEVLDQARLVLESMDWGMPLQITEVPMAGKDLSYLTFLQTEDTLLVPGYEAWEAQEPEIEAILGAVFPQAQIQWLSADNLAQFELWPSRMAFGLPPQAWSGSGAPNLLCASPIPSACGLCLDECFPDWKRCGEEGGVTLLSCASGEDLCLNIVENPCPSDFICREARCEVDPGPCVDIPLAGICDGDVLVKCLDGTLIKVDCQASGKFCGTLEEGQLGCVAPCQDECQLVGEGKCTGNNLSTMELCKVGPSGCTVIFSQECDLGCLDGACLMPVADAGVQPTDVVDLIEDLSSADPTPDSPVWGKADGGCQSGSPANRTFAILMLLVALGFRVLRSTLGRS